MISQAFPEHFKILPWQTNSIFIMVRISPYSFVFRCISGLSRYFCGRYGFTGYVSVQSNEDFLLTVVLPASQQYTISVRHSASNPELMVRDNAHCLWFSTWIGDYVMDSTTNEASGAYTSLELMQKMFDSGHTAPEAGRIRKCHSCIGTWRR